MKLPCKQHRYEIVSIGGGPFHLIYDYRCRACGKSKREEFATARQRPVPETEA